ncbi:hypothetical protein HDV00_003806 [Rhizophlyctis rosea]|nr:hypothetical protein HDV00_003806 [Rhizophlyctis rosea]
MTMRSLTTRQVALLLLTLVTLVLGVTAKTARDVSVGRLGFVVGSKGKEKTKEVLDYPAKLSKSHTLGASDDLVLAVLIEDHNGKPTKIRQVFLGMTSEETGREASFPLSVNADGAYDLTLPLKATTTLEALSYQPGKYNLNLYVGSATHQPIAYSFGTVTLDIRPDPKFGKFEHDVFEPLPEITHQFRADEKMPPVVLSQTFVLLVLTPWGLLALSWLQLGANITNLFATSSNLIFGSLFLGSLGSVLVLLYLYWLRLNIFQLLGFGAVLSLVTAVFGRQALVAHAAYRTKANK